VNLELAMVRAATFSAAVQTVTLSKKGLFAFATGMASGASSSTSGQSAGGSGGTSQTPRSTGADDAATLKSIRRHVERLAKGKATSANPAVMRQVRELQRLIANGEYARAGTRFHSLNFRLARQAQSKGALRGARINRTRIPTGKPHPANRVPDYDLVGGDLYDLKPWRNSPDAYDHTAQFQDISNATGDAPTTLYYQLWVTQ
jgi:hypothetical protein